MIGCVLTTVVDLLMVSNKVILAFRCLVIIFFDMKV